MVQRKMITETGAYFTTKIFPDQCTCFQNAVMNQLGIFKIFRAVKRIQIGCDAHLQPIRFGIAIKFGGFFLEFGIELVEKPVICSGGLEMAGVYVFLNAPKAACDLAAGEGAVGDEQFCKIPAEPQLIQEIVRPVIRGQCFFEGGMAVSGDYRNQEGYCQDDEKFTTFPHQCCAPFAA